MTSAKWIFGILALVLLGALLAHVLRRGDRASAPSSVGAGREERRGATGFPAGKETEVRNESPPVEPTAAGDGSPKVPVGKVRDIAADAPESRMGPPVKGETGSLMELYRGQPNAILRREALKKWAVEDRPGAPEAAEFAVRDADPTVILQALEILGSRGQRSSMSVLACVLQDNVRRPDGYGPAICEAAVLALGQCGDSSVASVLIKELERHDDLSYDTAVVKSLGMIGDHSALDALDRHIHRMETLKPTEAIALEPWRQAMAAAIEARNRIRAGGVR